MQSRLKSGEGWQHTHQCETFAVTQWDFHVLDLLLRRDLLLFHFSMGRLACLYRTWLRQPWPTAAETRTWPGTHRCPYQRRDVMCLGQMTQERHIWGPWNLLILVPSQRPELLQGFLCLFLSRQVPFYLLPFQSLLSLRVWNSFTWSYQLLIMRVSFPHSKEEFLFYLTCPKLAFRRQLKMNLL